MIFIIIFLFQLSRNVSYGQIYFKADPFYLLYFEKEYYNKLTNLNSLVFRPFFSINIDKKINWSLRLRSELFWNNNAPNLENTSTRWIGKGNSSFSSINLSIIGPYFGLSIEPYKFESQNLQYTVPVRRRLFKKMNDARSHDEMPFKSSGLREVQAYFHYGGLGLGVSNASMWWGPGLHSSLQMSTNTTGFRYFMLGTLNEQRINNIGLDIRYLFSSLDEKNMGKPYFTALLFSSTIYSNPQFTFGLSRSYLSGPGTAPVSDWSFISLEDAMLLPFGELFLSDKQKDPDVPESAVDLWDEILVAYLVTSFPSSGLKIYIEYGRDDHAWDWDDFSRQPDHSGASITGLRKYGLFGNENIVGGLEYTTLIKSKFWTKRVPGTWYSKEIYDHNSYDGRW